MALNVAPMNYSSKVGSSSMTPASNSIKDVYVDAMVVLKIIKHAHEETTDAAQGGLLGLVKDSTLEITNCFPFPNQNKPENMDLDLEHYQAEIIRNLRRVNSDYLQVGFYDSSFNRSLAQSMVPYQLSGVEESVALVYDQSLALQGYISLKAYRLTPAALENLKNEDYFSPDSARQANLNFENLLEELPVIFRNSHLVNSLLCEIDEQTRVSSKANTFLDLGTSGNLERQLRSLIDCVDEFATDAMRYTNYQKQLQRQQSRRNPRDSNRRADIYDEDFDRMTKVYSQSRRNALVNASQINNQCDNISQFAVQGLAKLFMAQAVHEKQ
jgi:translation initiation factor 3 subunit H